MRRQATQPEPQFLERIDDTEDLYKVAAALGIPKLTITDTKWPVEVVSTGLPVLIVPVRTLTAVRPSIPILCHRRFVRPVRGERHHRLYDYDRGTLSNALENVRAGHRYSGRPGDGSASGALGAYLSRTASWR